jgi:ethanolamine utilization protein EutQ (cupin superfamily)
MPQQVERFAPEDVRQWYRARGVGMAIGDVVDATNGDSMSVGFARYAKGASNEWTVTYDEALVITKGTFSVDSELGSTTARAGEVIFLRAGARIAYRADEDAELVYVTYPHWLTATEASEHARRLDEYDEITAEQAVV